MRISKIISISIAAFFVIAAFSPFVLGTTILGTIHDISPGVNDTFYEATGGEHSDSDWSVATVHTQYNYAGAYAFTSGNIRSTAWAGVWVQVSPTENAVYHASVFGNCRGSIIVADPGTLIFDLLGINVPSLAYGYLAFYARLLEIDYNNPTEPILLERKLIAKAHCDDFFAGREDITVSSFMRDFEWWGIAGKVYAIELYAYADSWSFLACSEVSAKYFWDYEPNSQGIYLEKVDIWTQDPPLTTCSISGTEGENEWYTSPVTITIDSIESTGGNVAKTYIFKHYGPPTILTEPTDPFSFIDYYEGEWDVIYYSVDHEANQESSKTTHYKIDTIAPTADTIAIEGDVDWTNSELVTISLTASDSTSGVRHMRFSDDLIIWGDWVPYQNTIQWQLDSGDGEKNIYFQVKDEAGNPSNIIYDSIILDTIAPFTTSSISGATGSCGWYRSQVTVTLIPLDSGGSGISSTSYRINGGPWQTYSSAFSVSNDGHNLVQYYSVDIAGNIENTNSIMIKIDTSAPVTTSSLSGTVGQNGWYTSSVTITLSPTDNSPGSGIAHTSYRIDGTSQTYSVPFSIDSEGQHTVLFYSLDIAGNIEIIKSIDVNIDTIDPSTSYDLSGTIGQNGWYTSPVTVTLSPTDSTSGVSITKYGQIGYSWQDYSGPFTINSDGEYEYCYYSQDIAGNFEDVGYLPIISIDATPPSQPGKPAFVSGIPGDANDNIYTLSWNPSSDSGSGIDYYEIYVRYDDPQGGLNYVDIAYDNRYTVNGYSMDETWIDYYVVVAVDSAGNPSNPSPNSDPINAPYDKKITNNPISVDATNPSIAIDNEGCYHIVWADDHTGNNEIFYMNVDENWNILEELQLSNDAGDSISPSIAVYGPDASTGENIIRVIWTDNRDGSYRVIERIWDDGSWSGSIFISDPGINAMEPDIAVDSDGDFHYVWHEVELKKQGKNWYERNRISYRENDGAVTTLYEISKVQIEGMHADILRSTCIAAGNDETGSTIVHVAFSEGPRLPLETGDTDFKYMRCINNVWDNPTILGSDPIADEVRRMSIDADNAGNVYGAWEFLGTYVTPTIDIMFIRSDDGGASWYDSFEIDYSPTTVNNDQIMPDIAVGSNGQVYLALVGYYLGQPKYIHCVKSTDYGITWTRIQDMLNEVLPNTDYMEPCICIDPNSGRLGAVWQGNPSGNWEIWFTSKFYLLSTPIETYYLDILDSNPLESGSCAPSQGMRQYPEGKIISIGAIPATDYQFDYWILDGQNRPDLPQIVDITMNTDHTLQPVFLYGGGPQTHYLTIEAKYFDNKDNPKDLPALIYIDDLNNHIGEANGNPIEVSEDDHEVMVQFSVTHRGNNYVFNYWENDIPLTNPGTVSVLQDITITAWYKIDTGGTQYALDITVNNAAWGTTDPEPGPHTYPEGDPATVTAIETSGGFVHWILDGDTNNPRTENPISIDMNADHTLEAIFQDGGGQTYTLTVEAMDLSGNAIRGVPVTINGNPSGQTTPLSIDLSAGVYNVEVPSEYSKGNKRYGFHHWEDINGVIISPGEIVPVDLSSDLTLIAVYMKVVTL